ncbi:hypothetical protein [Pseudochelatococcus sp. G4_1912]|uniref:hypothetical protein n=1 Tax=Pseudochelatococcus sp. G4_1912 TaxID=3114288 RepID=UPI0039C677B0
MALDINIVTQRSEAILRVVSSDSQIQLWANSYPTYDALDTFLIGAAQATVNPVFRLYQASFGRIPDDAGLNYWIQNYQTTSAGNIVDLAIYFSNLPEWKFDFESQTRAQAITQIYQNVLGREPDANGLSFWVNSSYSLPEIVARFTFEPEFTVPANTAIASALLYAADGNALPYNENLRESDFWPQDPPPPEVQFNLTVSADTVVMAAGDTVKGFSDSTQNNGNNDTYNGNDSITGSSDNVFELSVNGNVTQAGKVTGVALVDVTAGGDADTTLNTRNWTDIWQINLNNIQGNFHLKDIQSGATHVNIVDDARNPNHTIKLSYDSNEFGGEAYIGVHEVFGVVHATTNDAQNGAVETINLMINDTDGHDSTLADLIGHKTETLNITGGYEGGVFTITDALDSTLTKIDASAATSSLHLDTSKTFTQLTALLGSGDDVLKTGDTLGTGDVYDGGDGDDRIVTDFLTATDPNRTPTITNVETLEASFQAAVQLNGSKIDWSLATIDLNKSASRADFDNFNSGLTTINVNGALAQGLEVDYNGKDYADLTVNFKASAGNAGNKAALRVINADTVNINFLAAAMLSNGIQVDDDFPGRYTESLSIINKSSGDVVIGNHFGTAIVDGNTVQDLTIKTEMDGDLTVGNESYAAMAEANALQHLTIEGASNSTIDVGVIGTGEYGKYNEQFGDAADDLESVVINAANYATIRSWGIDADDSHAQGNRAATVTSINVEGGRSSWIELNGSTQELEVHGHSNIALLKGYEVDRDLRNARIETYGHNWLQAASIGVMNIETSGHVQGSVTEVITTGSYGPSNKGGGGGHYDKDLAAFNNLIGLDLEAQSNGAINVSGSGTVTGLWFQDEVVQTIDASKLEGKSQAHEITKDGYQVYFGKDVAQAVGLKYDTKYDFAVLTTADASEGFTFKGSKGNDYVVGTNDEDSLYGNNGNDFLIGNGDNDYLSGGDGDDILVGDFLEGAGKRSYNDYDSYHNAPYGKTGFGNDIIDGGAGNDIIIGGGQTRDGRDILTGGTGKDNFVFNFDRDHQGIYSESGKSTLQGQSVYNDIITDFTVGGDTLIVDVDNPNSTKIALYNGSGHTGGWSFIGTTANHNGEATVNVVVRQGTYAGADHDGVFTVDTVNGTDFQVLFKANGEYFTKTDFDLVGTGNGQNLYNEAVHEIALVGSAIGGGSLAQADIQFV